MISYSPNHYSSTSDRDTKIMKQDSLGAQVAVTAADYDAESGGEKSFAPAAGVFGAANGEKDHQNYQSVGWIFTGLLLTKSMIGLGVLTIPGTFQVLGLIPGIIVILVTAVMTTWSDWYVGRFKLNHPEVYSLADCGRIMFGRAGSITFGCAYWLFCTFVAGSAFIGISTALNAITLHGACTVVFVVVAALVSLPFAGLPRLEQIKWLSWVGLFSIVPAILICTIAVAAGSRPASAPQTGPLDLEIILIGSPSFYQAMSAVANIVFSFAGTPVFLPIASEMRRPADFHKSVFLCQSFCTGFYLFVGILMYMSAGIYVSSPALGTAGVLIKRVGYGIALPGLFVTAIIYSHLAAKAIFVRVLRNSVDLTKKTKKHWTVWTSAVVGCVLFEFVVAESIPVFGGLVGLVGALFGTLLTFQAEAAMYLYDHWALYRNPATRTRSNTAGVYWSIWMIAIGSFLIVGGSYGSIIDIKNSYAAAGGRPFSCKDNSNSV